ncbi:MAG: DUF2232 domain-containing protein [Rhodospirillales bacterium]|jgi:hypothetical protein|nr:DUF2232 domain-containing protein [Rhodospirillales bacterium]
MSRHLFIALGGVASAILSIAFATGKPSMIVLANLAPLPLFLVGLGYGVKAGFLALGIGLVLSAGLGGLMAAGMYGLVHALPSGLAIRQTLVRQTDAKGQVSWYPLGGVLCWLTAFAGVLLVAVALVSHGNGESLSQSVSAYLEMVFRVVWPVLAETERNQLLADMVPFFPGAAAAMWLAVLVGNGMLALAILTRSGRSLRPAPNGRDVALPDWISWLMVAAAALALLGSGDVEYIGRNLAMIMAVPFFVLGTAVIHGLARRVHARQPLLVVFYVVLFMSVWARMAVVGLGLIEQWVGVRHRVAGPNPVREDE